MQHYPYYVMCWQNGQTHVQDLLQDFQNMYNHFAEMRREKGKFDASFQQFSA